VRDLSRVLSTAETDLARLEADHLRWYAGLRELREWYKQDTKAVRDMFCNIPESPGDYAEGDAYAAKLQQIADRMRDRLAPKWAQLSNDASLLLGRARPLVGQQDEDVRRRAQRVHDAVTRTMASIQNVLNDELRGANDPEVRARMELGKTEHKRIQADSSKCTAKELTFRSRRIDCIRVDGSLCYVVEIKPNNEAAKSRGRNQIKDAMEEIRASVRGKSKDEVLEVLRPCFDDKSQTLRLREELRVYEYCPAEGALYKDFVVP